ncbi:penicillin acylase family protein [Chryseolinea sp. T2]|uniref:penicillin acylase family protein n=1 Tax=Chryseolinea sp. T2 TaxID=3129255 RepID=UPI003076DE61
MRIAKLLASLFLTIILVFILDNRWVIMGNPVPPLGRFLSPFQGFWYNLESDDDATGPTLVSFNAVKDSITVVYDTLGVPHIFASNDMDLYFAQGYVTARDRLWQMEFLTHAASGRVSEITGAGPNGSILDYDRGQRRLGIVYGAKRGLEAMKQNQDEMIMVEKYTEGVNAYISSLSYESLPFEFKLLNYRPEHWTSLKCALLIKSMAQSLCMGDKDMEMTNFLKLYGIDTLNMLYPDRENVSDPIVDRKGQWKASVTITDSIAQALPAELISLNRLPNADPGIGSNNWALSGAKTASGAPLLCGDPHLNLNMPAIWYAIQLHAPGINVIGASLPGAPGVVIGSNDSVAWSVTNSQRDLVDWYSIKFENDKRDRYMVDGKWVASVKSVEHLAVRDQQPVIDTIVFTEWGPVTYDETYHADDNRSQYAFRWIAHEPSHELGGLYKLNRAKNITQLDEALQTYSNPAMNFAIATTHGDIGMRVAGRFPVRRTNEGRFVLDGTISSSGWQRFIPGTDQINSTNPARGFESSANQYPVDETYPYYITATSFEAYRNRRINQQLAEITKATPGDMMALQMDHFSIMADENLPWMLSQLDPGSLSPEYARIAKTLAGWNRMNAPGETTPIYFALWINNILSLTWDEISTADVLLERPTTFTTLHLLRTQPELAFFDVLKTPAREHGQDIIRQAFMLAIDAVSAWTKDHPGVEVSWSNFKDTHVNHLLRIGPLSESVAGGGSADAINALSRSHGPSWRMVVSMEQSGVRMWATYPGGQSGNPGSTYYNNLIHSWELGHHRELQLMKSPQDGRKSSRYNLIINEE